MLHIAVMCFTGSVVIVSLSGLPLVGKTSVAQHVALQLRNTFPEFHVHINMQGKDTKFIEVSRQLSYFLFFCSFTRP